jgi:hypothetical protein
MAVFHFLTAQKKFQRMFCHVNLKHVLCPVMKVTMLFC